MAYLPGMVEPVKLMTQNQWMKGCPEDGEQGFLFSLYFQLVEGNCPCPTGCGYSVPRTKSHFFTIFVSSLLSSLPTILSSRETSFEVYINHLRGIVHQKCKRCLKEFCFACGEPINGPRSPNDPDLFHCSNLQGIILGVGLAMLEQLCHDQVQNPLGPKNKVRRSKRKKALKADTVIQQVKDEKLGNLMAQLRMFLPSLRRRGGALTSDYLVHPTALAHLRRRFNNICSSLLRNDSLTDMSDRSSVYFELFEWLEVSCFAVDAASD